MQIAAITGLLLAPLLNTYEISVQDWARQSFLLAPPPPPAPPLPAQVKVVPTRPRERFEDVLRQPHKIPEEISLIEDRLDLAPRAAPPPGMPGGVMDGVSGSVLGMLASSIAPPPVPKPVRVGGQVQAARLVNRVLPVFPEEAIEAGIGGRVILHAIIARDGAIRELSLESGHPMLTGAALEAVRQWRYRPLLLNGQAVEVETTVEVNFRIVAPPPEEQDDKKRRKLKKR